MTEPLEMDGQEHYSGRECLQGGCGSGLFPSTCDCGGLRHASAFGLGQVWTRCDRCGVQRRMRLSAHDVGPFVRREPHSGPLRIGLIARADNRGLGNQTWELYRHLKPTRTLVASLGRRTPYDEHVARYPDARVADVSREDLFSEDDMAWLLQGCDVLICSETPYDMRVWEWAREAGIPTVLQANPEFYPYAQDPGMPCPDVVLNPTTWRLDKMPGAVHLPHPVDRARLPFRRRERALTFLHVVGHRAAADRQGTQLLMHALRHIRSRVRVVIRTQSPLPSYPMRTRVPGQVVDVVHEDVEDYWSLYDGADVLIAPRRFGGQSLPVNEAHSCGLPVIALERSPESTWPGLLRVPSSVLRHINTKGGSIPVYQCNPRDLACAIDQLAEDPALVQRLSSEADARAQAMSWDVLGPKYLGLLERLASGQPADLEVA